MSTNAIIAAIGARAVWVDMSPNSVCMDPNSFESAITPSTKAAILYHVAGYPGPVRTIQEICLNRGIKLIEDCNNAMFSKAHQKYTGSFGDFAVYSFYPNRQLNTLEGGALVCRSLEEAERARFLRRFGINLNKFRLPSGEIDPELDIPESGWSYTMSNISAAVGFAQFDSLFKRLEKTSENVKKIKNHLSIFKQIHIVPALEESEPSHWVLLIQIKCRNEVNNYLKQFGIENSIMHYRNDRYSCFGKTQMPLPNTDLFQNTVLALPCGWWMDDEDITYMITCISSAIREYSVPAW
jgi:dTDP-4-amino-4,6-dideoxygalactose transaminase